MTHPWIMCAARAAAIVALPIALLSSAHAGDAAARKIIGFSPDGASFAFEQYAQLHKAPEVIAQIQLLEIRADSAVQTTLLTLLKRGDRESKTDTVRAELAAKQKPLLDGLGIGEQGTHFSGKPSMALDEVGIYPKDPQPLAKTQAITLPDGRKLEIDISDHAPDQASCEAADGGGKDRVNVTGMSLRISIDGARAIIRHQDDPLPEHRRCVAAYGIAEVYHHETKGGVQTLAVLIETVDYDNYHDGPNRRFMAVPTWLPKL